MDKKELNQILEEHKQWLYGDGGKRADLRNADLRNANLRNADLRNADLSNADLRNANLRNADLRNADLRNADLRNADLRNADLRNADLRYANGIYSRCPEEGSFIAYKKANNYIVKLNIPEVAKRSSATGRKCRCNKAVVLSIEYQDGSAAGVQFVNSNYDPDFVYKIGETVQVDNFDNNRWNVCAPGIHFFMTRQEAVDY